MEKFQSKTTDHLGQVYDNVSEMCKTWNISPQTYINRIKRGCSVQEALTGNFVRKTSVPESDRTDHLGQVYDNVSEMCKAWNVNPSTYINRIKRGCSVQEALTGNFVRKTSVPESDRTDHLGQVYNDISEMCKAWNVRLSLYDSRIRRGCSVQEALTGNFVRKTSVPESDRTDHLGHIYPSIVTMCKSLGIDKDKLRARRKNGHTIEESISDNFQKYSSKKATDHLGNIYPSISEMCIAWNTNIHVFDNRKKMGWSTEKALTTALSKNSVDIEERTDHLGHIFKTKKEMCEAWNINIDTYDGRRESGYTIEEALTKDVKKSHIYNSVAKELRTDHLGQTYISIEEMCKAWKVSRSNYNRKIAKGYTIEEILTKKNHKKENATDHLGQAYSSISKMCEAWCVNKNTYISRRAKGYTIEEALTGRKK